MHPANRRLCQITGNLPNTFLPFMSKLSRYAEIVWDTLYCSREGGVSMSGISISFCVSEGKMPRGLPGHVTRELASQSSDGWAKKFTHQVMRWLASRGCSFNKFYIICTGHPHDLSPHQLGSPLPQVSKHDPACCVVKSDGRDRQELSQTPMEVDGDR
jgi:hypothetical protein